MSKRDGTDWAQVELDIFGTHDPEEIRQKIRLAYDAYLRRQSTFGGYLLTLRRQLGFTVSEMAGYALVPELTWSSWEANMHLPNAKLVREIINRLKLGRKVEKKLVALLTCG